MAAAACTGIRGVVAQVEDASLLGDSGSLDREPIVIDLQAD